MKLDIDDSVAGILSRFESADVTAYITGGAIRDLIIGEEPHAYDIAAAASLEKIKALFSRTINPDYKRGTITIAEHGNGYNTASFLCDINEELSRRDFTINAMAYSPLYGLIDNYNGIDDIKKHLIRCVGTPQKSFCDDPVRMLRAIRFAVVLGFDIEYETLKGIRKCGVLIKKADPDRVREELNKILLSDHPERIIYIRDTGLMQHILPELNICFSVEQKNKYHIYDVGTHIVAAIENTPCDLVLRWSALFHDIGKPCCRSVDSAGIIHFYGHHRESVRIASDIMRRLRFDEDTMRSICMLVENHDVRIDNSPTDVKHMLSRLGNDMFEKLLILQEADNRGKNHKYLKEKLKRLNSVRSTYRRIIEEHQPYRVSDLAINPRDLAKTGFRAGREVSDTMKMLLDEVLIDPSLNKRDYLIKRARQIKNKRR